MRVPRPLVAAALAAGVGFVLVAGGTAVLLAMEDRVVSGFEYAYVLAAAYVIGQPLAAWLLLRLAGVRPAWLVAVLAPVVFFLIFRIAGSLRGDHLPVRYGLVAAAAYAVSAALVTAVAAVRHGGPPGASRDD